MHQITNTVNHIFQTSYGHFDRVTGSMTQAHWGLFAVIVIAAGVIFMQGKPVNGA